MLCAVALSSSISNTRMTVPCPFSTRYLCPAVPSPPTGLLPRLHKNKLDPHFVVEWLTNDDSLVQALTKFSPKIYDKLLK